MSQRFYNQFKIHISKFRKLVLVKSIKILMYSDGVYTGHKAGFLKYFDSVFNALRKKINVKELWIGANVGLIADTDKDNISYYSIFSFSDGNKVLEKLSPDLVIIPNSQEYVSRSLLFAAKFRSIPSVILYSGSPKYVSKSMTKTILMRLSTLGTLGKMFSKKYIFLIKTLFGAGYNLQFVIKIILKDIYFILTSFFTEFKSDDADMYICSNFDWLDYAIKRGIDRNKLVVAGEYAMDRIYDRVSEMSRTKSDKIEILFITTAAVEHGLWKPLMREEVVTKTVKAIKEQARDIANLRIKIHPTSEVFEDYKQIISKIDGSIEIIQKGDLFSLIYQSDLIITFGQSTALLQVLLLNKPLFIINLFNERISYIEEKVATECKTPDVLVNKIIDGSYSKIDVDRVQAFVEKQLYKFDGKCGERAANQILLMLKATRNNSVSELPKRGND